MPILFFSFTGSYGRHHMGRPLSRTLSSPLVALSPIGSPQECQVPTVHTFTTGLLKKLYLYIHAAGASKSGGEFRQLKPSQ